MVHSFSCWHCWCRLGLDSVPSRRTGCQRLAVVLPQHADEHRPQDSVLLAVDQELGEGLGGRIPQYEPIASTRSKSGSMRIWSSSARGAGPSASRRLRRRRSSSSGRAAWSLSRRHDGHPHALDDIRAASRTDGASMPPSRDRAVAARRGRPCRSRPRSRGRDDVQEGYVDDFHVILGVRRSIS